MRSAPRTARLRCEPLEGRLTPAAVATAPPDVFPGYHGEVATAGGDVTGDGTADPIVAAAVNGHVKVLDGRTGAEVRSFLAYPGYRGPVAVAATVPASGAASVVTAAGRNGHVKVFDTGAGAARASFLAFPGYDGPVAVAAGATSVTNGPDTFTVTPGPIVARAGDGRVKAFTADGGLFLAAVAFPGYAGPVRVGAADLDRDGTPDVVAAAGVNGHVEVLDGRTGAVRWSLLAYPGYAGPVEVEAAGTPAHPFGPTSFLTRAGNGHVKVFDARTRAELASFADADGNGVPDDGRPVVWQVIETVVSVE